MYRWLRIMNNDIFLGLNYFFMDEKIKIDREDRGL